LQGVLELPQSAFKVGSQLWNQIISGQGFYISLMALKEQDVHPGEANMLPDQPVTAAVGRLRRGGDWRECCRDCPLKVAMHNRYG
jgi:hypothetical protein